MREGAPSRIASLMRNQHQPYVFSKVITYMNSHIIFKVNHLVQGEAYGLQGKPHGSRSTVGYAYAILLS